MKRSNQIRAALAATLAITAATTAAKAAIIAWSAPTTISGDSDVSTTGTLVMAKHLGTVVDPVVSGVTFTAWNFPGGYIATGPTTQGDATMNVGTTDSSQGASVQTAAGYVASTSLSASYKDVLNAGCEAWNAGTVLTLTLANLMPGDQYQLQSWSVDSREGITRQTTIDGAVTLDENLTDSLGGAGQYAIGTFTADAATQAVVYTGQATYGPHIVNAFQLRDVTAVPEPVSIGLLGMGGMGLMARRRRFA